jgi:predicted peroxiredoxin
MSQRMLFNCTHGAENPERATLPFVAANVAATAGLEAIVVCTVEAVRLGTHGGADDVAAPGLPPLAELLREFVANGGQIWLCGACTKPRGIGEEALAAGVKIVGAAKIVETIAAGATPIAFA